MCPAKPGAWLGSAAGNSDIRLTDALVVSDPPCQVVIGGPDVYSADGGERASISGLLCSEIGIIVVPHLAAGIWHTLWVV